jgi:hypothetical protein
MDSTTERFTGDDAARANLFVKDTYREPFVIREQRLDGCTSHRA